MTSPVALRCYVDNEHSKNTYPNQVNQSSSLVLVFDTETTVDEFQNLMFGSCGIWSNGKETKLVIFYNEELLKQQEIQIIRDFASRSNYEVMTCREFVTRIFYPYVFFARAKCVCFNAPFDLSRLAISYGRSRIYPKGFSFKLSDNPQYPNIVIKSLNTKAAFIEFRRPLRKKSEKKLPHYKGCFIDLKTLTFALTNESYNLEKALTDFNCALGKIRAEGHGKITEEYVEYNVNDTLATYELYVKAIERYRLFGLKKEVHKLYSPASIGKGFIEKIGVKPFLEKNPDFPKDILGYLMTTYYGGRTEVRIRKQPTKISYLDFTSMYPSIYVLLGMDKFLKCRKVAFERTTEETQSFLNSIELEGISNKETWTRLATICRIIPDNDIFPVRSKYDSKNTYNIGINYLKSEDNSSLWYTLADLIASKLLAGKTPKIKEAITFHPEGRQDDLNDIEILQGIHVSHNEDFIKKLIEERIRIKKQSNKLDKDKKQADLKQNILKIIANATSYGIFIEINSEEGDKEQVKVFGLDSFETEVERLEREGKAFNPIMATLITAGSRLLLASAEALLLRKEGYLAYTDTDSVFVSPNHVYTLQEFFRPLNPYSETIESIKVEDDKNKQPLHDVWFYGISAKRYILYDYDKTTRNMLIRKHSAHGLGHLQSVDEEQWWYDILSLHYNPHLKEQILSKYRDKVAFSQLTISNYDILQRFEGLNENKLLKNKTKPFNFITVGTGYRIDPHSKEPIIPMLPFVNSKSSMEIPYMDFIDYKTGLHYPNAKSPDTKYYWKPLSQVFEDYVAHRESKSEGDVGQLGRRRMTMDASSINYIGKETNELEVSEILGAFEENYAKYTQMDESKLKQLILGIKKPDASKYGLSERNLTYLKNKIRNNKPFRLKDRTKKRLMRLITTPAPVAYYRGEGSANRGDMVS